MFFPPAFYSVGTREGLLEPYLMTMQLELGQAGLSNAWNMGEGGRLACVQLKPGGAGVAPDICRKLLPAEQLAPQWGLTQPLWGRPDTRLCRPSQLPHLLFSVSWRSPLR